MASFPDDDFNYNGVLDGNDTTTTHTPTRQMDDASPSSGPLAVDMVVPQPKRPRTAYNLFFRDEQYQPAAASQQQSKGSGALATRVCDSWAHATPRVRQHYEALAVDDTYRYRQEQAAYRTYLALVQQQQQQQQQRSHRQHHIQQQFTERGGTKPLASTHPNATTTTTTTSRPTPSDYLDDGRRPPAQAQAQATTSSEQHATSLPPPCTRHEIAFLASKLDAESIDIIIRVFK